ncbi:hypothetical protein C5S36_01480, partial [Candidatus Methanophagaceae archaeon]
DYCRVFSLYTVYDIGLVIDKLPFFMQKAIVKRYQGRSKGS